MTTKAICAEIEEERERQQYDEGYTADNDDLYCGPQAGELSRAAASYCASAASHLTGLICVNKSMGDYARRLWPWNNGFKPKKPREDLVRAGALIVAEIERIDRAEAIKRKERINLIEAK